MLIGHANVICNNGQISEQEARAYIDYIEKKNPNRKVKTLDVDIFFSPQGREHDEVELHWTLEPVGFERIRRITGYLVGTLDNWNDGKCAEEADRVKHDTEEQEGEV